MIAGALALLMGSLTGSLLPDLDHPESKLGRRTRPFSTLINLVLGHRGGTHSLLFLILPFLGLAPFMPTFALGLALGTASHILADMISYSAGKAFTKGNGCPLLWPVSKKRFGIRLVQVNGMFENVVVLPLALVLGGLLLSLHVV